MLWHRARRGWPRKRCVCSRCSGCGPATPARIPDNPLRRRVEGILDQALASASRAASTFPTLARVSCMEPVDRVFPISAARLPRTPEPASRSGNLAGVYPVSQIREAEFFSSFPAVRAATGDRVQRREADSGPRLPQWVDPGLHGLWRTRKPHNATLPFPQSAPFPPLAMRPPPLRHHRFHLLFQLPLPHPKPILRAPNNMILAEPNRLRLWGQRKPGLPWADSDEQCRKGEFPAGELNNRRVTAVEEAIKAIEAATDQPELRSFAPAQSQGGSKP